MWLGQTQFQSSKIVNSKICLSVFTKNSSQIKIRKATSNITKVMNWRSQRKRKRRKKKINQVTYSSVQFVKQILKREKSLALCAVYTFSIKTASMCGFSKSKAVVLFAK